MNNEVAIENFIKELRDTQVRNPNNLKTKFEQIEIEIDNIKELENYKLMLSECSLEELDNICNGLNDVYMLYFKDHEKIKRKTTKKDDISKVEEVLSKISDDEFEKNAKTKNSVLKMYKISTEFQTTQIRIRNISSLWVLVQDEIKMRNYQEEMDSKIQEMIMTQNENINAHVTEKHSNLIPTLLIILYSIVLYPYMISVLKPLISLVINNIDPSSVVSDAISGTAANVTGVVITTFIGFVVKKYLNSH